MKSNCDQKQIKADLNEILSETIKLLQQESQAQLCDSAIVKSDSAIIKSDSASCQQFIAVIEAAFVHGLKDVNFVKQNFKIDLPNPQFWSLAAAITHKSILKDISQCKFIRTQVGKCRAWLRLALNDCALSSYLTSLFFSSEHASLLQQHYKSFALFLDHEQRDIFMSYLQGIENLMFEIAYNSSVLNAWTKTPLELSGLISSNSVKLLLPAKLNRSSLSSGVSHLLSSQRSVAIFAKALNMSISAKSPQESRFFSTVKNEPATKDDLLVDITEDEVTNTAKDKDNLHQKPTDSGNLTFDFQHDIPDGNEPRIEKSDNFHPKPIDSGSLTPGFQHDSPDENEPIIEKSNGENLPYDAVCRSALTEEQTNQFFLPFENQQINSSVKETQTSIYQDSPLLSQQKCEVENVKENKSIFNEVDPCKSLDVNSDNLEYNNDPFNQNEENICNFSTTSVLHSLPFTLSSPSSSGSQTPTEKSFGIYSAHSHSSSTPSLNDNCSHSISPVRGNSLSCAMGWSSELDGDCALPFPDSFNDEDSTEQPPPHKNNEESKDYKIREGSLQMKDVGSSIVWRTRYFILSTCTLSYFRDNTCNKKLGEYRLSDIKYINDSCLRRKKIVSVQLLNDDKFYLASSNKINIAGWFEDLIKALQIAKSYLIVDPVEASFVVVDEIDDVPIGPNACSANTSWNSSMRYHITRIAKEKGLDMQNYQCFDCAAPIGMLFGLPRVCHFTGHYFCHQCHLNEEHQIPAKMIHNWDFDHYKVSKRSMQFLMGIWKEPCIELNRVNPIGYIYLDKLKTLLPLRNRLTALYPYISTCNLSLSKDLIAILKSRYYMVENTHLYSPHDLSKTRTDKVGDLLNKALTFAINHVTTCSLCLCKGFYCEICGSDEVIFAFQTDRTIQCEACKAVYHKVCVPDISKCRKCERRNRRMQIAGEERTN